MSRQLWWGHRIPAWYDDAGKIYVGRDEAEVRKKHSLAPGVDAHAGRRRARHLVLLGAVAVLHARLAGHDAGAAEVLSDERAGHGLRHHLLLGRPHDHDGPEVHGRRAVQATCTSPASSATRTARRCRSPRATSSTRSISSTASSSTRSSPSAPTGLMQPHLEGQDREGDAQAVSRRHRRLRHRRAALHVRLARRPVARHQLRSRPRRRLPQLLQQAVERRALRADDGRRQRPGDLVGAAELSIADRWIVSRFAATLAQVDERARASTASTSRRPRCTNSPGTSSATGTSS